MELQNDNYRTMYFENIRHNVKLKYALLTVSECLFTKHMCIILCCMIAYFVLLSLKIGVQGLFFLPSLSILIN